MKKGFTLIEMIGVLVILSLLLSFIMPNVINYIKKGGDIKDKATKEIVYNAAKKYMDDYKEKYKKDKNNTYCISTYELAAKGYIVSPIVLSSSNKDITLEQNQKYIEIKYNNKYIFDLKDECDGEINPTPVLTEGLTPVVYDGENWKVVDKNDPNWYDYDEQKWANAVVLGTDVVKEVGDEVAVDGTEAKMMLVWIPRYEYKIEGTYGKHPNGSDGTQALPGEIKVNFVIRTKNGLDTSSGYRVHPSFTFGKQDVSGFWVGKFEISSTDYSFDASQIRVLPNKESMRDTSVSIFFTIMKDVENSSAFGLKGIDTHMIKNSEWGAIAYLSQSKYGKYGNNNYKNEYKEVYDNRSDSFITGSSNGTPPPSPEETPEETLQCEYDDMTILGEGKGNCGPGASTTGNIYGVYDMSGGTYEYVMGVYGDSDGIYSGSIFNTTVLSSGFNGKINGTTPITNGVALPNEKYYDKYQTPTREGLNYSETTACDSDICFGHALSETLGWYDQYHNMANIDAPWIARSGNYSTAGLFGFFHETGAAILDYSTRLVGIIK